MKVSDQPHGQLHFPTTSATEEEFPAPIG